MKTRSWHVHAWTVVLSCVTACVFPALLTTDAASAQVADLQGCLLQRAIGERHRGVPRACRPFASTANCTDTSQPLNAWGVGFFQEHLRAAFADPQIVALGVWRPGPAPHP